MDSGTQKCKQHNQHSKDEQDTFHCNSIVLEHVHGSNDTYVGQSQFQ